MDLVGYRTTDGRFVSNFRVVGRSFRKVFRSTPRCREPIPPVSKVPCEKGPNILKRGPNLNEDA